RERLPTLSANGEGTVQSDNIGFGDIEVPLENFSTYLDIDYDLFDGGLIRAKKQIEKATLKVNQQHLKVSLRTLKNRINTQYFAIKLARQQKALLKTSIDDIETNIQVRQAGYENGSVLESEVSKLKVRKLELLSESSRLEGDIKAYFSVLGQLIGTPLSTDTVLELPIFIADINDSITRPEQELYKLQKDLQNAQESIINAGRMPKVSVFAQGGLGYPNPLNFSDINTATYALTGVRLKWDILDWGIAKKEREKLQVEIQQTEVDKRTFEFDIAIRKDEFREKMKALREQIENDQRIVGLQGEILQQIGVQLANGVINSSEYLEQVNAELAARQEMELHMVELQQLHIDYLTLFGKL
ncbi:MAG: TolC family protein, partial [Bacteroidota bacterium]